ncbi:hypothetical protein [Streptomyces sp. NPDC055109]
MAQRVAVRFRCGRQVVVQQSGHGRYPAVLPGMLAPALVGEEAYEVVHGPALAARGLLVGPALGRLHNQVGPGQPGREPPGLRQAPVEQSGRRSGGHVRPRGRAQQPKGAARVLGEVPVRQLERSPHGKRPPVRLLALVLKHVQPHPFVRQFAGLGRQRPARLVSQQRADDPQGKRQEAAQLHDFQCRFGLGGDAVVLRVSGA